jgi:hypothetical protein
MKIGCIVNHVPNPGIVDLYLGYLLEPVIINAMECGSAVARKLTQPPDRIALGNPKLKPVLTPADTVIPCFPNKCPLTPQTLKPLFK